MYESRKENSEVKSTIISSPVPSPCTLEEPGQLPGAMAGRIPAGRAFTLVPDAAAGSPVNLESGHCTIH